MDFSEHVKNKPSLKKAAEWAEQSVMRGETSENTYILAKFILTGIQKRLRTLLKCPEIWQFKITKMPVLQRIIKTNQIIKVLKIKF
jgi:hypothetical protein